MTRRLVRAGLLAALTLLLLPALASAAAPWQALTRPLSPRRRATAVVETAPDALQGLRARPRRRSVLARTAAREIAVPAPDGHRAALPRARASPVAGARASPRRHPADHDLRGDGHGRPVGHRALGPHAARLPRVRAQRRGHLVRRPVLQGRPERLRLLLPRRDLADVHGPLAERRPAMEQLARTRPRGRPPPRRGGAS